MKKTNGLTFVEERAVEVLLPGNTAYQEGTHLFAKHHARLASAPQQNTLPNGMEKGTPDHVLYLFLTTLVTLQSDSDEGFLSAKGLWDEHPECFTRDAVRLAETLPDFAQQSFPFFFLEAETELTISDLDSGETKTFDIAIWGEGPKTEPKNELARLFKYYGFNKPNPWSRYWADTVRTLFDEYGGDPLAIIDDVKTVNGFLAKKRKANREGKPWWCNGMGPKLFSLFCIFCEAFVDRIPAVHDLEESYGPYQITPAILAPGGVGSMGEAMKRKLPEGYFPKNIEAVTEKMQHRVAYLVAVGHVAQLAGAFSEEEALLVENHIEHTGPKALEEEVSSFIAMAHHDPEAAYTHFKQLWLSPRTEHEYTPVQDSLGGIEDVGVREYVNKMLHNYTHLARVRMGSELA